MLTRSVRCAMQINMVTKFEQDLKEQRIAFKVIGRPLNGVVYEVEVPMRLADVFATFVNSNYGKML